MADCPVPEAEALEVLRVAQFSQVLNDLRPIMAQELIEDYPTLRFLRQALMPCDDATVLDLGCSSGKHLREAQLLIPCDVVGLDIDLLAMQIGGVAFEQAGHAAPSWCCASITDMPFADESFSHVLTAGTLSLLPIRRGLAEIRRILRPGGTMILTIEGPGLWRWLYDQAPPLSLQRLQLMRWRVGSMLLNNGIDWQANPWTRRLAGLTPMTPSMIHRFVREAGFHVEHCDTLTRHRGLPRIVTLVAHKEARER
jgi:SAM-dependent methyltransferase